MSNTRFYFYFFVAKKKNGAPLKCTRQIQKMKYFPKINLLLFYPTLLLLVLQLSGPCRSESVPSYPLSQYNLSPVLCRHSSSVLCCCGCCCCPQPFCLSLSWSGSVSLLIFLGDSAACFLRIDSRCENHRSEFLH